MEEINLHLGIFAGLGMAEDKESGGIRGSAEPIEVVCPKCRWTAIIYLPREPMPQCPTCQIDTIIKELLNEGKSF